ncbi:Conserved_hypothetical protein [Hexamita inflata]|uniref:Uncharacterized protein n=1 Tax=Hexamita inflata TaxID=28002 RepID=A0AA86PWE8_9EUKA|nr:Conserved hypothetical protein [Hexamita inflata]
MSLSVLRLISRDLESQQLPLVYENISINPQVVLSTQDNSKSMYSKCYKQYTRQLFSGKSAFSLVISPGPDYTQDFLGQTNILHYIVRQIFLQPESCNYNLTYNHGQVNGDVFDANSKNNTVNTQLEGDMGSYSGLSAKHISSYESFKKQFAENVTVLQPKAHQVIRFHVAKKKNNPLQITTASLTIVLINALVTDSTPIAFLQVGQALRMNKNYIPFNQNRVTRLLRNFCSSESNFSATLYVKSTDLDIYPFTVQLFDLFNFQVLRKPVTTSIENQIIFYQNRIQAQRYEILKTDKMITAVNNLNFKPQTNEKDIILKLHKAGLSETEILKHISQDNILGVSVYDSLEDLESYNSVDELRSGQARELYDKVLNNIKENEIQQSKVNFLQVNRNSFSGEDSQSEAIRSQQEEKSGELCIDAGFDDWC